MKNTYFLRSEMFIQTKLLASIRYACPQGLSYREYNNATIIPWIKQQGGEHSGGCVDEKGNTIPGTTITEVIPEVNQNVAEREIRKDENVIFIGNFIPIWGHAITDNLKRIWFLYTDYCSKLINQGYKLVAISHYGGNVPPYVLRILELAGLKTDNIEFIDKITTYNSIVIPDNSIVYKDGCRFYHEEYLSVINKMRQNINSDIFYEKVYFSRTQLPKGRDFGEEAIERSFFKHGYKIIYPEKLTVEDQISILKGCRYFAATEGSISHSAIFCSPNTDVCIIRKCNYVNPYQMFINEAADLNVTFVDAHKSIRSDKNNPWLGPFYLENNKYLKKFFGDIYVLDSRWFRYQWWWYILGKYPTAHSINSLIHRMLRISDNKFL